MKKSLFMVLTILAILPLKTFAWGEKGHEIVAQIAFKQLDKKTRKLILSYLDGMTIEQAANWMDDIKKDHSYDKLKPLHYVNFEKGESVKDSCCDNIIHSLNATINDLKHYKDFSKEEIKTKLCFLFHLMGDLHQPLHVGYRSDKGGNSFQVNFNSKSTNLHGLLDYGIIEYQNIKLNDCLKYNSYNSQKIANLCNGSVLDWAKESRSYLGEIYGTNKQIEETYLKTNSNLIKSQIQKAGIRLGGILKETFQIK
ncbi:S1/P1 nuclease [Flavobacterium sp.]|uniref:S1/P1 nuclease n=1 Tax=Flavobacterium sp. TaxID=239 RepID=UPI003BCD1206